MLQNFVLNFKLTIPFFNNIVIIHYTLKQSSLPLYPICVSNIVMLMAGQPKHVVVYNKTLLY